MGEIGENMAITRDEILDWMVRYQTKAIKDRYKHVKGSESLLNFFSTQIYSSPEESEKHQERNKVFKSLSRSIPVRVLLLTMPIRIRGGVNKIIELYEETNSLEVKLVDALCGIVKRESLKSVRELRFEHYQEAMVQSSTYKEKKKQIEDVIEVADFIQNIIERESLILETAIRFLSYYGVARIITDGYDAFKDSKESISQFKKTLKKEEMDYLSSIYNPMTNKCQSPNVIQPL